MDRQRVKVWLRKAYAPLDQMADRLFVARALEDAGMQGSASAFAPAF
jgi:hypothetical protein